MKILIPFFLLIAQAGFSQDCDTRAANKPSVLAKGQENYANNIKGGSANITKMRQHLGKAESWAKNILTGFTGAKILYNNNYYFDYDHNDTYSANFYKSTGIKGSYIFEMSFYAHYCYDNTGDIQTEVEAGSFLTVVFNNVFISDLSSDAGVYNVKGRPVFRILEKDHSEGRIDFYDLRSKTTVNDTIYTSKQDIIIIRNSDKPVFITVTRKEYLEQLLNGLEAYKTKRKAEIIYIYNSQVKEFEAGVKIFKAYDKSYTAEKEALQRQQFLETNNPEKLNKDLSKLDVEVKDAGDMISQYLKKPQDWLGRNFRFFYPYSAYTAKGLKQYFDGFDIFTESKEDLTRTEVVSLNPAYFNKGLSNDVPQLIAVHLQKGSYPHMLKVAGLVKKDGVFAPLEAILNTGSF